MFLMFENMTNSFLIYIKRVIIMHDNEKVETKSDSEDDQMPPLEGY